MKKFVAVNAKYYKNSNSEGCLGHVNRVFKKNKNVITSIYKNFGDSNLLEKYKNKNKIAETLKGKKFQKNANTYIDEVIIFSSAQIEILIKKYGYDNFKEGMTNGIREYQRLIQETDGFEPIGFNFHLDEGYQDPETGIIKYNYHAHAIFLNYSMKSKKNGTKPKGYSPLREMKKENWSAHQDIIFNVFKKAGFIRGIKKELKQYNTTHLEKNNFVKKKHKSSIKKLEEKKLSIEDDIYSLDYFYKDLMSNVIEKFTDLLYNHISGINDKLNNNGNSEKNLIDHIRKIDNDKLEKILIDKAIEVELAETKTNYISNQIRYKRKGPSI
ncbi:MAG: hypothetical protein V7784_16795 [Oceanospirillaceae bacterium]